MTLQVACDTADVDPGEATLATLTRSDGTPIDVAIARDSDGTFHALDDMCTHENISLSDGDVDRGALECWKHGSSFDLRTGQPRSLPATRPVAIYHLELDGTSVLVDPDITLA